MSETAKPQQLMSQDFKIFIFTLEIVNRVRVGRDSTTPSKNQLSNFLEEECLHIKKCNSVQLSNKAFW